MTEVVTSLAAIQQSNLLSQRQQVFGVVHQGDDSNPAAAGVVQKPAHTFADTSVQYHSATDYQNTVNRHDDATPQRAQPAPGASTGPSRPRIEIKHIDAGLTPSEVVGTPDILQRFDTNGDGRIDQFEAARAGLAREGVFTFSGLTAGNTADPTPLPQLLHPDAPTPAPASSAAPGTAASPATAANTPFDSGSAKIFTAADLQTGGVSTHAFVAAQSAAQGTPSGLVDAPAKFYGQGAEVVVGKFAVADVAPKFVEKVSVQTTSAFTETGTGETKLYDKVAQADTGSSGQFAGDTGGGAAFQQDNHPTFTEATVKHTVLVEVAAYADASAAAQPATAEAAITPTVVTA